MSLARLQTRRWRSLLLLPLLFALVFRAFIPAGYMPIVGSDGHFAMALCSDGLNPKLTYVATQAGEPSTHEHEGEPTNGPCGYAATTHVIFDVSAGSSLLAVATELPSVIEATPGLPAPGAIPRAQSPRAPPALS